MAAYKRHAESYYRKHGRPTSEYKMIVAALRFVRPLYGREPVAEFGPLKLQAIQQAMIQANLSRARSSTAKLTGSSGCFAGGAAKS